MLSFLLTGQSNMSGRGDMNALKSISNKNLFVLRGKNMEAAEEPIVRDRPFSGEGLSLTFANAVHMLTSEPVLLLPASLGGSPLNDWMPGEALFENALTAVHHSFALGATLSGVLWHQGEADGKELALAFSYSTRLTKMMVALHARIREEAEKQNALPLIANPLPTVVGELGAFITQSECPHRDIINRQLGVFASQNPARAIVSSKGLTDKGDHMHFDTRSLRMLGLRYANAWAEIALTRK